MVEGGTEIEALTDNELRSKLLEFKQQIFTFGFNFPEDEVKYGQTLKLYQNEAERRKKSHGFKIKPDNEEPSQFYYQGFSDVDRPKHDPVDESVNYLQLLLGEKSTKQNLITRRPSQRSSKNLEHIVPNIVPEENLSEK
nr:hypothetical protein [Tanacetum cinerariifolium]